MVIWHYIYSCILHSWQNTTPGGTPSQVDDSRIYSDDTAAMSGIWFTYDFFQSGIKDINMSLMEMITPHNQHSRYHTQISQSCSIRVPTTYNIQLSRQHFPKAFQVKLWCWVDFQGLVWVSIQNDCLNKNIFKCTKTHKSRRFSFQVVWSVWTHSTLFPDLELKISKFQFFFSQLWEPLSIKNCKGWGLEDC